MDFMLARKSVDDVATLEERGWCFDLKIDGIRAGVRVDHGTVTMKSRRRENITPYYPELVSHLCGAFAWLGWTEPCELDCEIAVNDERGLPSWPLTHARHAAGRRGKGQATLYVFDVTTFTGDDVTNLPFVERRAMVERLTLGMDPLVVPVLHGVAGTAMWDVVEQYNLEGLVAKRPDHRYRAGRSSDWLKLKRTRTMTCVVGGYDPGEGSRRFTFGNLHLYLTDGDGLVSVGKVGSGFTDRKLAEISGLLHDAAADPIIVEVECLDVSPDRQLRQPVFQRLRTDVDITACSVDQLETNTKEITR